MLIKIFVIISMLVILISLGSGLIFLVKDSGTTQRTLKALTWRISLSLILFAFLFLALTTGWIKPHQLLSSNALEHANAQSKQL